MNPLTAARAYGQTASLAQPFPNLIEPQKRHSGEDFGAMVSSALNNVASTALQSDKQSAAMAAGKADLVDVVTAVAETEVAIESLVSVRDKVIQAYEEIMRMPI